MSRIWLFAAVCALACGNGGRDSPVPSASAATRSTSTSSPVVAPSLPAPVACTPACSSIEKCDQTKCVPNCPAGEVFVPATGPEGFKMGRGGWGASDQRHSVVLTKPFCMDQTEVTVAAYRSCVESEKCTVPQLMDINSNFRPNYHREDHPVNMVNFAQATEYCQARGQALPTEAQFEWASGHGDGRKYTWGNDEPTCENGLADFTPGGTPHADPAGDFGCDGGGTSPVKSHPKGVTRWPGGEIYDLGGNVWEWTSDCYLPYPRETQTDPNPQTHPSFHESDCYVRSLRGGGWNRSKSALEVSWRAASKRTYRVPALGFRCVRNPS